MLRPGTWNVQVHANGYGVVLRNSLIKFIIIINTVCILRDIVFFQASAARDKCVRDQIHTVLNYACAIGASSLESVHLHINAYSQYSLVLVRSS